MAGSDAASRNNAVRASDGRLGTEQEGREQLGLGKGASLRGEKKNTIAGKWVMGPQEVKFVVSILGP